MVDISRREKTEEEEKVIEEVRKSMEFTPILEKRSLESHPKCSTISHKSEIEMSI